VIHFVGRGFWVGGMKKGGGFLGGFWVIGDFWAEWTLCRFGFEWDRIFGKEERIRNPDLLSRFVLRVNILSLLQTRFLFIEERKRMNSKELYRVLVLNPLSRFFIIVIVRKYVL